MKMSMYALIGILILSVWTVTADVKVTIGGYSDGQEQITVNGQVMPTHWSIMFEGQEIENTTIFGNGTGETVFTDYLPTNYTNNVSPSV